MARKYTFPVAAAEVSEYKFHFFFNTMLRRKSGYIRYSTNQPANMQTLKHRHELIIHALTSKLWTVLTHPDYTGQFLFDGKPVSKWIEGEPIMVEEVSEDVPKVISRGMVEEMVPGLSLSLRLSGFGHFNTGAFRYHFELSPVEGGILLTLLQEGEATVGETFRLIHEQGMMMLQKIKWLAEFG